VGQESGRRPKFEPPQRDAGQEDPKSFNGTVGEGIRRARQERGWTQAFLAEQAGLSSNYVARLERGELGPSLFVANQICQALGIELEALVSAPGPAQGSRKTAKRRSAG
jgi:transcriptional regulator with XRE-family HTH domain